MSFFLKLGTGIRLMRKLWVLLFFIILLLPTFQEAPPTISEGASPPPSPSLSTGGGAGEWDSIDTFEVHPKNRWSVYQDTGLTVTVADSVLNITDVGDGTQDTYQIYRELSSLDGKVIIRFKLDINETSSSIHDRVMFYLSDEQSSQSYTMVEMRQGANGSDWDTFFGYQGQDGWEYQPCTGTEAVQDNEWYILRFDYDLLRSELQWRLYNDEKSKIASYDFYDLNPTNQPKIFEMERIYVGMHFKSFSDTKEVIYQIDYVEAKFDEIQWDQESEPTDSDWNSDTTFGCQINDDIDDTSEYRLTVPYLDGVSGTLDCNFTDIDNLDNGDLGTVGFYLYGVEADDGDLQDIFTIGLTLRHLDASGFQVSLTIDAAGDIILGESRSTLTSYDPLMTFTMSFEEARTQANLHVLLWENGEGSPREEYFANVTIADECNPASHEFVLATFYDADFTGDSTFTASIEHFDFIHRESVRGLSPQIEDPWVASGQGAHPNQGGGAMDPLSILFRTLGEIIGGVAAAIGVVLKPFFDSITSAINSIQGWLTTLGTTISNAIANIQGWLTTLGTTISNAINQISGWLTTLGTTISNAIDQISGWLTALGTVITDAIDAIAADIWAGIGDALDFITDAIAIIVEEFFDWLWGVGTELAAFLVEVGEELIAFGGNILAGIIIFIAGIIFFVWEALGLPDILAIIGWALVGIVQFVNGIPVFLADVTSAFQTLFYLVPVVGFIIFFGFPLAQGDIGGYFEKMTDYMGFDITFGFGLFGNQIQVPVVVPWFVVCLATVLVGTTYAGFF